MGLPICTQYAHNTPIHNTHFSPYTCTCDSYCACRWTHVPSTIDPSLAIGLGVAVRRGTPQHREAGNPETCAEQVLDTADSTFVHRSSCWWTPKCDDIGSGLLTKYSYGSIWYTITYHYKNMFKTKYLHIVSTRYPQPSEDVFFPPTTTFWTLDWWIYHDETTQSMWEMGTALVLSRLSSMLLLLSRRQLCWPTHSKESWISQLGIAMSMNANLN